jgi:hypothetical protein
VADYLRIESWLGPIAAWLWGNACYEHFADWVLAARLQSMQQRRKKWNPTILTDADVSQFLATRGCPILCQVLTGATDRFIATFGLDMLLDAVEGNLTTVE